MSYFLKIENQPSPNSHVQDPVCPIFWKLEINQIQNHMFRTWYVLFFENQPNSNPHVQDLVCPQFSAIEQPTNYKFSQFRSRWLHLLFIVGPTQGRLLFHLRRRVRSRSICVDGDIYFWHEQWSNASGRFSCLCEILQGLWPPESQKAKTFRIARFLSQKLSG